jgi:hypothetical protein
LFAALAVFLMRRHRRRSPHSRTLFAEGRSTHSKQSTTEIDAVPAWVRNASGPSHGRNQATPEDSTVYTTGMFQEQEPYQDVSDLATSGTVCLQGTRDEHERHKVYVPSSKRVLLDSTSVVLPEKGHAWSKRMELDSAAATLPEKGDDCQVAQERQSIEHKHSEASSSFAWHSAACKSMSAIQFPFASFKQTVMKGRFTTTDSLFPIH